VAFIESRERSVAREMDARYKVYGARDTAAAGTSGKRDSKYCKWPEMAMEKEKKEPACCSTASDRSVFGNV